MTQQVFTPEQIEARKKRAKEWRSKNPERAKELSRRHTERTVAKIAAQAAALANASKECGDCKATKPLVEFFADNRRADGRQKFCKECGVKRSRKVRRTPEGKARLRAYQTEWQRQNPEKLAATKKRSRLRRYGLTLEALEEMIVVQDNKCLLCGSPAEAEQYGVLAVDHCHVTGVVRGLLCQKHNQGLGLFGDSPALLRAAADYVERHAAKLN